MIDTPIPTVSVQLTNAMQAIYTVPANADHALVLNLHASNAGGANAPANLTMEIGGRRFYDAFPIGNTLDRDTYLLLAPGTVVQAMASANNALTLFLTMSERYPDV